MRRKGAARLSHEDRALVDLLREHAHIPVVVNSACVTLGLAPAAARRDVTWFLQQDGLALLLRALVLQKRFVAVVRDGYAALCSLAQHAEARDAMLRLDAATRQSVYAAFAAAAVRLEACDAAQLRAALLQGA